MTTAQKFVGFVLIVGLMVVGVAAFYGQNESKLGGSSFYEDYPIHFGEGLYAGSTKQLSVDNSGNLTTTGTVTGGLGSFSSTGTTTLGLSAGNGACINANATSSATPVAVYFRYATSTAVGYNGFVTWKYGACS